jgi:hypothetical protein
MKNGIIFRFLGAAIPERPAVQTLADICGMI